MQTEQLEELRRLREHEDRKRREQHRNQVFTGIFGWLLLIGFGG